MTVLIFGATGFLGAHTVAAFENAGVDTTLIGGGDRWRLDALGLDAPLLDLDRVKLDSVKAVLVLSGASSPAPLTLSSIERVGLEARVNQKLIASLIRAEVRPLVVLAGSRTQYGQPDRTPVNEQAPLQPQSPYAAEKVFVERLYEFAARDIGLPSVRLRITNPYGPLEWVPGRRHGLISIFCHQAVTTGVIRVFDAGQTTRDYVHIDDFCRLLLALVRSKVVDHSVALNVGSGTAQSIRQVAQLVAETLDVAIETVPAPVQTSAIETGDFVADISRAKDLVGWSPAVHFETAVPDVVRSEADRISTWVRSV